MGFFDRQKKGAEPEPEAITIPEPWECAKRITQAEAENKSNLPLGWYYYQMGFKWLALKPDPEQPGKFDACSPMASKPEQLEEWLGVPVVRHTAPERKPELENRVGGANVRAGIAAVEQKHYLEKMGLTEQPPTEEEKQLAEKAAVEELGELPPPLEEKKPKKRKSQGRTNQIMTRLTDAELKTFQSRVKKSGLAQGEYLRSVALTGQVVINERSEIDVAILDELAKIRAELGRQGGLLKMVIKPNEGQRELAPEEWAALIGAVREMEKARDLVSKLEVKVTNGNYQAPKQ